MKPMTMDKLDALLGSKLTTDRPVVSIDFETRSRIDLPKAGPRKYAEHAEVLCMAYSVNGAKPKLWVPGYEFPAVLAEAELHAWNAGFEIAVWDRCCGRLYGWPEVPPHTQWVDTQARAALAGLPLALGQCAIALGLPIDKQKDKHGRYLIRQLCIPRKDGTFLEDRGLLADLFEYCKQDVVTEQAIAKGLPKIPEFERRVWAVTDRMNDHGLPVDAGAAHAALAYIDRAADKLQGKVERLTKGEVETVAQIARLRGWLAEQGVDLPNLQVATVDAALADPETPERARKVLEVRRAVGLASVKKYAAVVVRETHGRVHDTLRYHGAGTGRWSGAGLQPQNLKRPDLPPDKVDTLLTTLAESRTLPGYSFLRGLSVLSDCVRGVIRAEPGHVLLGSDYSQIELRVLLWLAGDEKNLQELREGLDPYKTMAADVFTTEYEAVTKDQRQVGKAAVLGCGYQLGGATFTKYAKGYGIDLTEEQGQQIVDHYRTKYSTVVRFWYDLQDAALRAIHDRGTWYPAGRVKVRVRRNGLFMELRLPSGRPLRYFRPHTALVEKEWGTVEAIKFEGLDTYTRRWSTTETYGGKLVENATQGFARDIMAVGILNAESAGLNPILTVHDEVVCHPRLGRAKADTLLDKLNTCLLDMPTWADGLPLGVEGWADRRYRK